MRAGTRTGGFSRSGAPLGRLKRPLSRINENLATDIAMKILSSLSLLSAGILVVGGVALVLPQAAAAKRTGHVGHAEKKGCTKCHKEQFKAWLKTRHGKAMENLQPGVKKEEKIKAKLEPNKDYTTDKDCLECHTTGFRQGGYIVGNKRKMKKFSNVGCEACHGGGKKYQEVKKKYEKDDWPRKEVIAAGMKYGEKAVCENCHNDDSPFKASVDPKYAFSYKKMLKKGTHKHYRLEKHPPRKGSEWLYEEGKFAKKG